MGNSRLNGKYLRDQISHIFFIGGGERPMTDDKDKCTFDNYIVANGHFFSHNSYPKGIYHFKNPVGIRRM